MRVPMPRSSQKNNVVKMPTAEMRRSASEVTLDAIARRAYEIYSSLGCTHGHDIDDWLQAERELHVSRGRRRARSAPVP
jgi:hypothetical protein